MNPAECAADAYAEFTRARSAGRREVSRARTDFGGLRFRRRREFRAARPPAGPQSAAPRDAAGCAAWGPSGFLKNSRTARRARNGPPRPSRRRRKCPPRQKRRRPFFQPPLFETRAPQNPRPFAWRGVRNSGNNKWGFF